MRCEHEGKVSNIQEDQCAYVTPSCAVNMRER
jgi:hypothetical protein